MKVTYIHHSSFLVELDHMAMLFDYFEGDIPAFGEGKPLVVFASHRHGDHFAPVIFELAGKYPQVYYILSDDIWKKRVPDSLKEQTRFMGPGETLALFFDASGRNSFCGEGAGEPDLSVKTFRSTDEGVAFLIQAEGRTIYHAGDLRGNRRIITGRCGTISAEKWKSWRAPTSIWRLCLLIPDRKRTFTWVWTTLCGWLGRIRYSPCISGGILKLPGGLRLCRAPRNIRIRYRRFIAEASNLLWGEIPAKRR